jgi:hypothetical protein
MCLLEVIGVACIMGGLFGQSGRDITSERISEVVDLVSLSLIYFAFSTVCRSVISHYQWFGTFEFTPGITQFSVAQIFVSRVVAVTLLESYLPTLFCIVCFPLARLVGDVKVLCQISFLLATNNMCYISLGAIFGGGASTHWGLASSTAVTQATILASGVFTILPSSLEWARYVSPFFWTFQGILKCILKWSDNYGCVHGSSSELPPNRCFIEVS